MEDSLYTFLLDFRDRIYISQVHAGTPQDAVLIWGQSLDVNKIKYMGEKVKEDLVKDLQDEEPVAISGMTNVWGFAIVPLWRFGMVNFVKSVGDSSDATIEVDKRRLCSYTFILHFQGGTYISQVYSEAPDAAMRKWGEQLSVEDIVGLGDKTKEILIRELEDEHLAPVSTVENVWCFHISPQGRFGIVHVVKTSDG